MKISSGTATTQFTTMGKRTCRLYSQALLLCLVLTRLTSTHARRVRGKDEEGNRHLELPPLEEGNMLYRDYDNFPGQTFVVDQQSDWKRMKTTMLKDKGTKVPLPPSAWTWKKKKSKKSSKKGCYSGSSKSGKGKGTHRPSASPHPTTSDQPSSLPSLLPSAVPSLSLEPSFEPSESPGPSASPEPTGSSKSGKGTYKSARCEPTAMPSTSSLPTLMPVSQTSPGTAPDGSGPSGPSGPSGSSGAPGAVCNNIFKNTGAPEGLETESYDVSIAIEFDSTTNSNEIIGDLDTLNPPLALWSAGCETLATEEFLSGRRMLLSRHLEGEEPIEFVEYVEFENWAITGTCTDTSATCSFFTKVIVSVSGDVDDNTMKEQIKEAFEKFVNMLLASNKGITSVGVATVDKSADNGVDQVVAGDNTTGDNDAGIIIGAAAGALALLLIIVLLARRRRNSDEVSHLKLDDEGEATFVREFEDTASDPSRKAHVVGETDSIFSGWTGYTKDGRGGSDDGSRLEGHEAHLGRQHGDVHICSSATCEVCERRRQQGLQFIPTGTPPRPQSLPSNAERDYVAEDTVEL